MIALYFRLRAELILLIIPDTLAHLDGHTIITHTYSIFKDTDAGNPLLARSKESSLHLENIKDPNYFGFITFEMPEKFFTYTADGPLTLEPGESERIIEFLSDVRTNPALWSHLDR